MANVLVSESSLQDIASAIRTKNGTQNTYKPAQMGEAIRAISGGGGITPTGTKNITENGTYDVTNFASANVNVPTGSTPTGTKTITANGTHDVAAYASADVNVPNSYSASDEGKVVNNGSLVSQTSQTVTANGTYDTTLKNEMVVNVPSSSPNLGTKTITQNGTYAASSDSLDGYSEVTVNVPTGGGGVPIDNIIERSNFPETITYTGTHELGEMTFAYVSGLKHFTATKNILLRTNAFNGCTDLESVSLPESTTNNQGYNTVFQNCTKLSSLNLPKVRLLGQGAVRGCTSLHTLVLPAITATRSDFANGARLEKLDLGVCTNIQSNNAFLNNSGLDTIILRASSVCALGSTANFSGTPFASGGSGGTLYVPQSLISNYQSATNWSTILGYANNSIVAIEGSQYENYYADGTPIA